MMKDSMEKDKLRDKELLLALQDQIAYLRKDITHKNEVIKTLISYRNCHVTCNSKTCNRIYETVNDDNHVDEAINLNNTHIQEANNHHAHNINEKNITFRKSNSRHDVKKKPKNPDDEEINKKSNKTPVVEIIGDSILNNIAPHGISRKGNVAVSNHSGATSEDIIDKIKPIIKKKPDLIIIHIGTNDLTKKVDTIPNLQSIINRIKKKSAATNLVISSILQRRDHPDIEDKVIARNKDIEKLCDENLIRYLNNNNINEGCLAKGKLHPNKKGNSYLANNFMRIIEDID